MQVVRIVEIQQQFIQCFVLLRLDLANIDVGLGTAVTMPAVVIHHPAANAEVSRFLIILEDRRVHTQAARIDVIGKTLSGYLAGHFGDKLGVHWRFTDVPPNDQGLIECSLVLPVGDEAELVHPVQDILLADTGTLWIDYRVVSGGCFR